MSERTSESALKYTEYANGAQKIQQRCACIRWSASECFEVRNRPQAADFEGDWADDDDCECSCHDAIRRLEEDIWGFEE
jgi:hypothetical protein